MLGMDNANDYRRCDGCGASLQGKRSDARYCGDRCRQRAHRAAVELFAVPIVPTTRPTRLPTPSSDDIAELFMVAGGLEASFRFAAERVEVRLRPMCTRMADAIATAIEQEERLMA